MIRVNEKCISCGLCVRICPTGTLGMKDRRPAVIRENCIACGHCVAVCPTEALDHELAPLAKQANRDKALDISAAQAEQFIRSRRSIRWYKNKPVSREALADVLRVANYAQTGRNLQGVEWIVYDDAEAVKSIGWAAMDYFIEMADNAPPENTHIKAAGERYATTDRDLVLLGAPCLAVTVSNESMGYRRSRDSACIAITTAQMYAPTHGLGTCWAGLLEMVVMAGYEPVLKLLDIPKGKLFTGAMMIGYPAYEYKRLTERNPVNITWRG